MSQRQGRGAARGPGAASAERAANMAGVADAAAAAPGSGGEGRRGGAPEQQPQQQQPQQQEGCRGEPKTLWGSSEPQAAPQQRTETLGFYESDRGRKKKRGLSGEQRSGERGGTRRGSSRRLASPPGRAEGPAEPRRG